MKLPATVGGEFLGLEDKLRCEGDMVGILEIVYNSALKLKRDGLVA